MCAGIGAPMPVRLCACISAPGAAPGAGGAPVDKRLEGRYRME